MWTKLKTKLSGSIDLLEVGFALGGVSAGISGQARCGNDISVSGLSLDRHCQIYIIGLQQRFHV